MERTLSPFRRRLFRRVAGGFAKAVALAAELVLRTEDWRMKCALSAHSPRAEADRLPPLYRLAQKLDALPKKTSGEQINALLDAYHAAYKASAAR